MIRPMCAVLAGALLAVAACDDASAPEGQAGSVTVTAYIDRDATGTLTDPDLRLAGIDVSLVRDGETIATATTDATGVATFESIAPGGYRVVLAEEPPQGVVLTTSPSPSAVVSFQGTAPDVEFRFTELPATISGRVFRNDGGTAEYESGTDTPGAGVGVYLRADDGGTPGDTLRVTAADEEGAYVFTNVAPGTYFVEFEQLGAMNYGATRIFPVTVGAGGSVVQSALFTGSIFLTIAEARAAADDEAVAVVGTITVAANTFTSSGGVNSELWVQDETGGIAVFSVPSASTEYTLGRVVEVVGQKDTFNGKEQIGSPTIRVRGNGTVPAPLVVTGTQTNSLADEGELVRIENVEVTAVGGSAGSTAYDVTTLAPDGQTVLIRVATGTNIAQPSWTVGANYDITGVLTEFRGTAQIQPRGTGDILELGAPPAPTARVIINEFMANPAAVSDNNGEYIELHNWGDAAQDLQGWTISDNNGTDTIDVALTIPAGGYVLFAVDGDPATNGGLTVDWVYRGGFDLGLAQAGDRIVLKDASGVTVDSIAYTSNASTASGVAVGVIDPTADNAEATLGAAGVNWAAQTTTFGAASDRGTPRAQNDGYVAPPSPNRLPVRTDPVDARALPARAGSLAGDARR